VSVKAYAPMHYLLKSVRIVITKSHYVIA